MPPPPLGWILVLVVGLMLIFAVLRLRAWRATKTRRAELEAYAGRLGFRFDRSATSFNVDEWRDFSPFTPARILTFLRGGPGAVSNAITGRRGDLDVAIVDYRDSGNRSRSYWTAVCIRSPALDLPAFRFNTTDESEGRIEFPGYPKLARSRFVHGEDAARIRTAFTPAILEFFSAHDDLAVHGAGRRLVVYSPRAELLEPGEVRALAEDGFKIAELFGAR